MNHPQHSLLHYKSAFQTNVITKYILIMSLCSIPERNPITTSSTSYINKIKNKICKHNHTKTFNSPNNTPN